MADSAKLLIHHLRALVDPARHEKACDDELLARWAASGDSHAFAALVWRHGPMVWRVARSVLRQPQDAEDAFQATFMILARKAAKLKRRHSVAGWLYQAAYQLALNARRAESRRHRRQALAHQPSTVDPLDELTVREARAILTEELQHLPAAYRDAVVLCLYEGTTQEEAARQLGCARGTLAHRLERGRALLSQRLTRRGLAPASALAVTLWSHSAVSGRLVEQTITAAKGFALSNALPSAAAALAHGALRTVILKKLVVSLSVVFVVGGLTLGAALVPSPQTPPAKAAVGPAQGKPENNPPAAPRLDHFGDPLPPGAVGRVGSGRFRHGGEILRFLANIAYTPDGKSIVSAASDGSVRMWEAGTGKSKWQLTGTQEQHFRQGMAISEDGKTLALLSNIGYMLVGCADGKQLAGYQWPNKLSEAISSVAISPDLSTLALGCDDGLLRVYDASTGKEMQQIAAGPKSEDEPPSALAFSKDGKALFVGENKNGRQAKVVSFDVVTGKLVRELPIEIPFIAGLVFSDDYRLLLAFGGNYNDLAKDGNGQAVIWDVQAAKVRNIIKGSRYLRRGVFSPDSKLLALHSRERADRVNREHLGFAIVDAATGEILKSLPSLDYSVSVRFSPDGQTLAAATGMGGCITLWDVATGKLQSPSPQPLSPVYIARFLPGDKQLFTMGEDGAAWWDLSRGDPLRYLPGEYMKEYWTALSPDGKTVVKSNFKESDLALVDVATGQTIRTLSKGSEKSGGFVGPEGVAFSPDGAKLFLAAGGSDPRVLVWEVATGRLLHEWKSLTESVYRVAVSPDGRWLASWTPETDGDIRLWDIAAAKLVRRLTPRSGSAATAAFSADSSQLVTIVNRERFPVLGGELQVWDVVTGAELPAFRGAKERFFCAAMTADGRMISAGHVDHTLRLLEVASGLERAKIEGHQQRAHSLDFSKDSRLLAAASSDAPVYLWDPYALEKSHYSAKLTVNDQGELWQALAGLDATKAFQAMRELIARPTEAVSLMRKGWQALPRATVQQVEKWIAEVEDSQYAVREKAVAQLQRFGASHEALLRQARDKAASLELRRRLDIILERRDPEKLRRTRMLEVLERIGTGPAQRLLQEFADQPEDTELSREAGAGLKRL